MMTFIAAIDVFSGFLLNPTYSDGPTLVGSAAYCPEC